MNKLLTSLFCATFSVCLNAQTPITLGSTATFGVLGGSTVTNTGGSVVNGNLGVSPGAAVTGFGPGIVIGGTINAANPVAAQAESDLTAAYNEAAGRACPGPPLPGDIGGTTIAPGVHCAATSLGITGTVTLNGNANPNAVFIFQIGSTLTTAAGSFVNLTNGAQASNVFWQVGSSATLGTNTVFNGTIMALASITLNTGAKLNGRALARNGAVTLDTNAIATPPIPGPPGPLSLTCSFPSGTAGQPYISSLLATGGIPPYTYSISAGSLPPGLTLNPVTGAISGTPSTAGSFGNTSKVTDSTAVMATSSCGITIAPAEAGVLSLACAANSAQAGQPYLSSLVASGGVQPYAYSISAGSLPSGLTLNPSTGVISGTPTATGTFSYTGRIVDSTSAAATSNCGITLPPVTLSMTCASSSGQVGQPYSSSLVVTGGVAPYTFSITAGSLPPGLTLNPSTGLISGTPTTVGTYNYTTQVVDSTNAMLATSRPSPKTRAGRFRTASLAGGLATSSCGLFIVAPGTLPTTPAPPSLLLVATALVCAGLYQARERLLRMFRRN